MFSVKRFDGSGEGHSPSPAKVYKRKRARPDTEGNDDGRTNVTNKQHNAGGDFFADRRHSQGAKSGKSRFKSYREPTKPKMEATARFTSEPLADEGIEKGSAEGPEDEQEQTTKTVRQDPRLPSPKRASQASEQDFKEPQRARLQKRLVNLSERVQSTIEEDCEAWGIDSFLIGRLHAAGMKSFFPIQRQAIPGVMRTEGLPTGGFGVDVCVSAPTGSGKTLVYVLPIVQALLERTICRLRALVVVPSRDLAIQVKSVFDHYCAGSQLVVGLAIGQSNFADEQLDLVGATGYETSHGVKASGQGPKVSTIEQQICGGYSLVDILVATPGRLIDHLRQTPGFTLQHLRYLVVDEADRLLNQSYYDWIAKVYDSAYGRQAGTVRLAKEDLTLKLDPASVRTRPKTETETGLTRSTMAPPFRRMLFSATLTRNPKKLAALGLLYPQYYATTREQLVDGDPSNQKVTQSEANDKFDFLDRSGTKSLYSTPEGLSEYMLLCETGEKPLFLIHLLLREHSNKRVIIFTSSVESTHRLTRLLQLYMSAGSVGEYSGQLAQAKRSRLLQACRDGRIKVLVCSDAMARGMDLQMECVINYDMPTYVKTYIHRVGRTARAGQGGTCVTLLRKGQEKAFRTLLKKVDNNFVRLLKVERTELKAFAPRYVKCLDALKTVLEDEQSGTLSITAPLQPLPGSFAKTDKSESGQGEQGRK